jgi:hypothetical protein
MAAPVGGLFIPVRRRGNAIKIPTDKIEYEKHVRRIFGTQQEMDF